MVILTSMWKCAAVKASRALELWAVCEVHVAEEMLGSVCGLLCCLSWVSQAANNVQQCEEMKGRKGRKCE